MQEPKSPERHPDPPNLFHYPQNLAWFSGSRRGSLRLLNASSASQAEPAPGTQRCGGVFKVGESQQSRASDSLKNVSKFKRPS